MPMSSISDPRDETRVRKVGVIAFYFPGRETVWDCACSSSFLGNFWPAEVVFAPPGCAPVTFANAEAAFQASKFWTRAAQFSRLSGGEAFELKRSAPFHGREDWSYGGFGPPGRAGGASWLAMRAVLRCKFAPGSKLAATLLDTGDALLLEHCERPGRDTKWSDDCTGSGANLLGCALMIERDALRGRDAAEWTQLIARSLDLETGMPLVHGSGEWQHAVQSAASAVLQQMAAGRVSSEACVQVRRPDHEVDTTEREEELTRVG
jgi:hypothetical protein